ncbi:MAG: hypothetical protein E7312_06870 [Clostridiales bacterium]|nr:hypothetical protein [Clostridiales bacterium]
MKKICFTFTLIVLFALELFSSCGNNKTPSIFLHNLASSHPLAVTDEVLSYSYSFEHNSNGILIKRLKWMSEVHEYDIQGEYELDLVLDTNDISMAVYDIMSQYAVLVLFDDVSERDSNNIKHHKRDVFVRLNDNNGKAEVLYQCNEAERILFGNSEYVILYNNNENCYCYVDCDTKQVIKTLESGIKGGDYYFTYGEDGSSLMCTYSGMLVGQEKVVDTIPIVP